MPGLHEKLSNALRSRKERSLLRRVISGDTESLVDFSSNDYLSLTSDLRVRSHFLRKLQSSDRILGVGGSRMLTDLPEHEALEARLSSFFGAPAALLFNSGFDADVGFFSVVPQNGDVVIYDDQVHASVHDGMRGARTRYSTFHFRHNSVACLKELLEKLLRDRPSLRSGDSSVLVAVESLYSMDGDFAPLNEIADLLDSMFLHRNGHLVVDEAHATGLYGKQGRGVVSILGLEKRVLARLHTFGKAPGSSGAVVLTSPLIREYLVNYSRPFLYTTTLPHSTVVGINCSFDILEDEMGDKLSKRLNWLCRRFLRALRHELQAIPSDLITLPEVSELSTDSDESLLSPIVPLFTQQSNQLAAHLRTLGFVTRSVQHPAVPKGKDRVRICINAGRSTEEIDGLVAGLIGWLFARHSETIENLARL